MGVIDRINGLNQGVAYKAPVRAASIADLTLSGTQTVDGITLVADDRILVKDQTNAIDNGIYIVSSSDWVRSRDFDGARDVTEGTVLLVLYGTVESGNFYRLSTTDDPVDFGSSNISFALHSTLATNAVKNNFAATTAPLVTNDSSQGYSVGSLWVDVTNDVGYINYDATVGAAVWISFINLGANNTFTGNQTFNGVTTLAGT
ncbi:hypothetical protein KAU11_06895, partial [Candidatus Babeliales bacterium]|nr:hypothetical protein [Candidatus Babeliales bacterium]